MLQINTIVQILFEAGNSGILTLELTVLQVLQVISLLIRFNLHQQQVDDRIHFLVCCNLCHTRDFVSCYSPVACQQVVIYDYHKTVVYLSCSLLDILNHYSHWE